MTVSQGRQCKIIIHIFPFSAFILYFDDSLNWIFYFVHAVMRPCNWKQLVSHETSDHLVMLTYLELWKVSIVSECSGASCRRELLSISSILIQIWMHTKMWIKSVVKWPVFYKIVNNVKGNMKREAKRYYFIVVLRQKIWMEKCT